MVAVAQPVEHLIVVQEVASSDLVGHPIYPSSKMEKCPLKRKRVTMSLIRLDLSEPIE